MAYGLGYGLAKMAEGLTGGAMQAQQANEQKRDRFVKETLSLASIMDPEYAQKFVDKRLPDYGIVLKRPQMKPQNVSITLPGGETIEGERAKISDLMGRAAKSGKPLGDLLNDPQVLQLAAANGVSVSRPKPAGPGKLYPTAEGLLPMDQAMGKMPYQAPRQPTAEEIKYGIYKKDPDYFKRTGSGAKQPTPKQAIDEIQQAMNAISRASGGELSQVEQMAIIFNPSAAEKLKSGAQSPEARAKIENAKAAIEYYRQFLPPGYNRSGINQMMGGQGEPAPDAKPKPTDRFNPRTGQLEPVN